MKKYAVACQVDNYYWFPYLTEDDSIDWTVTRPRNNVKIFFSYRCAVSHLELLKGRIDSHYKLEVIEI